MTVPRVLIVLLLVYAVVDPAALAVGVPACAAVFLFSRWLTRKVTREIEADEAATLAVIRRRQELQARVREQEGDDGSG